MEESQDCLIQNPDLLDVDKEIKRLQKILEGPNCPCYRFQAETYGIKKMIEFYSSDLELNFKDCQKDHLVQAQLGFIEVNDERLVRRKCPVR